MSIAAAHFDTRRCVLERSEGVGYKCVVSGSGENMWPLPFVLHEKKKMLFEERMTDKDMKSVHPFLKEQSQC